LLDLQRNPAFLIIIVAIFGSLLAPVLSINFGSATSDEEGGDTGGGGDDDGGNKGGDGDEPEPEPEPDPGFVGEPIDPCEEDPEAKGCPPEPPIDPCIEDPTAEGCEPEPPICEPCPPSQVCPDVCEPLPPPVCDENPSLPECEPVPIPTPPDGACHPSYPGRCIPSPPPDLDCGDVSARNFRVVGSDPHGFDGDNDGIGCEGSGNGGGGGSGGNGRGCDPSYPEDCIPPPPPDLNCGDRDVPNNVKVVPPDPHRLDGDKDGVGCEGGSSRSGGGGNGNNNDGVGGSSSASECQGQADCFRGTVTEIVDGDTLDINNVRVRLASVNTPERGQNGYTEAIDFLQSICGMGTTALVDEDDEQKEGSFDRLIGLVYCGNDNINNKKSLNELLLERGYAVVYQDFCNISEFSSNSWAQRYGC
jgi:hypothetical protein